MGRRSARSIGAAIRRQERDARKRARESEKAWKAAQKIAAAEAARLEVEAFDAHMDELTSIHRECVDAVDWAQVAAVAPPPEPQMPELDRSRSKKAKAAVLAYKPNFFERIFGLTGRKLQLDIKLTKALASEKADEAAAREQHAADLNAWAEAKEAWAYTRDLAQRVLRGDVDARDEAIGATGCLQELEATLGSDVEVAVQSERAEVTMTADEATVVPEEQKILSAKGAVSTKKLPAAKRMEVYQDYVCGAALRASREIMATIPLDTVLVHVKAKQLDSATGNQILRVILSVMCTRTALRAINWEKVDASDLVSSLTHRMKVTRGKGFVPVEPLGNMLQSS
jgi:hypothetical protein